MITPIKIHPEADAERFLLMLISEELKSIKFFKALMALGFDNAYCRPHLDEAILTCLGITKESNKIYDFYFAVMNEHAERIGVKAEHVAEEAKAVCRKLSQLASMEA